MVFIVGAANGNTPRGGQLPHQAGCQRARPFTPLNGVGNTLGAAHISCGKLRPGGDWCPFAGRLMQNRHSCRLFQVIISRVVHEWVAVRAQSSAEPSTVMYALFAVRT